MKKMYKMNPGNGVSLSGLDALHNSNNAFVKSAQNKMNAKAGKNPVLSGEYCYFDAEMINTGEKAQDFGGKLTSGLDKDAFPVK